MKINFFAPMNNLGYGIHAYNTIREFEKRGHEIVLIPPLGKINREMDNDIRRWFNNRESFSPKDPSIMIFMEDFLPQFSGDPRIGFPVFELEKFTPVQLAGLRSCDYLFTPSAWGKGVLVSNGLDENKIFIVNEGYDPDIFPYFKTSTSEDLNQPFTFVHVGKFEERKGTMQIIDCFARALENEEARLLMSIHNPFRPTYPEIQNLLARLGFKCAENAEGRKICRRKLLSIHFHAPVNDHKDLSLLYQQADCGLYPSRAEGWGLPILETLATGVPCIVGNWTGQSEYLGENFRMFNDEEEYYYKEGIRGAVKRERADDGIWFDGSRGDWNVVTDEALAWWIKHSFENYRKYRKTEEWSMEVSRLRQFTWARAAKQLEAALLKII